MFVYYTSIVCIVYGMDVYYTYRRPSNRKILDNSFLDVQQFIMTNISLFLQLCYAFNANC